MRKRSNRVIRPIRFPMIVKAETVLRPLEEIIEQIERDGTVNADRQNVPVFFNHADNTWYATAPAITGIADAYEMWGTRHSVSVEIEPLRQLVKCLHYGMPVTAQNLLDLRAILPKLRRVSASFEHLDASDIIRATQIKEELERVV